MNSKYISFYFIVTSISIFIPCVSFHLESLLATCADIRNRPKMIPQQHCIDLAVIHSSIFSVYAFSPSMISDPFSILKSIKLMTNDTILSIIHFIFFVDISSPSFRHRIAAAEKQHDIMYCPININPNTKQSINLAVSRFCLLYPGGVCCCTGQKLIFC